MIPVYSPHLHGNEKKYVIDCLDTTWISSKGKYIREFEEKLGNYMGTKYVTTVHNGTVAIHLALLAIDIKAGDEIIVPSFTYIASVNMIIACGAIPVFVDSDIDTWQLDIDDVVRKITPKTKAVMAVHLYGFCCDLEKLVKVCSNHNLKLIEDCAEAFGTFYKNQHVGTFGDVATFSFFGNKTITTGEGGACVAKSNDIYQKLIHIKNQGVSLTKQYWHDIVAYNYRMTNIQAAIGVAQMEQIDEILLKKRKIADYYRIYLDGLPLNTDPLNKDIINSYWMCSITVDADVRDKLRDFLSENNIETRPFFHPAHILPMCENYIKATYPNAEKISAMGINLPSYPDLTEAELELICSIIRKFFNGR